MAKIKLTENYNVSLNEAKQIPLNESNRRFKIQEEEYSANMAFEFPMWKLDSKNLNNRIYSTELAQKVVDQKKVTYGLCDHPSEESEQPEGSVKDVWAIEQNPHIKEGILFFDVF